MLSVEQICERLKDRKLTKVASGAGLPYMPVWRLASGNCARPAHDTIEKLSKYFESQMIDVVAQYIDESDKNETK
jgi:hypothetical protein